MKLRKATIEDMMLYFKWANDPVVRQNSINKSPIYLEDHKKWFSKKIEDEKTIFLIFEEDGYQLGQLRIDLDNKSNEAIINFSIDESQRGNGFSTKMLVLAYQYYLKLYIKLTFTGYVQIGNKASSKAFEKAGFQLEIEHKLIGGEYYLVYRK